MSHLMTLHVVSSKPQTARSSPCAGIADSTARDRPLLDELAVLVENLHAIVPAVAHIDAPAHRIGGDAVHRIEITRTRLGRGALLAPRQDELAVPIELRDTRAVVAVGHEQAAVGEPCENVGRLKCVASAPD